MCYSYRMSTKDDVATNTRRARRKLTPQKLADRGRTVMRITNHEILGRLDIMLEELRNTIECRRRPGIHRSNGYGWAD